MDDAKLQRAYFGNVIERIGDEPVRDELARLKDTRDALVQQYADLSRRHQEVKQALANALEELAAMKLLNKTLVDSAYSVDGRPCPSCGVVHRS